MKRMCILLTSLLLSITANAAGFCEKLGTKLNQINFNAINHLITMNYTVSGVSNFSHIVEYRFKTNNITESLGKELLVLENCYETSNTASFTLERVYPYLNVLTRTNLKFTIDFTNSGSGWNVSKVSSSNCNDMIHESLVNTFREVFARRNRYTHESFYTFNLKNMVKSEVCPAHINKLRDEFNKILRSL